MSPSRMPDPERGRLREVREQSRKANTFYDTLEVIPTASPQTIQAAYRSLISRYHPDKVAGLGQELQAVASARTKEINQAYDVLSDAVRRAHYDEELRERESFDEELRERESYGGELRGRESHGGELRERKSPAPRRQDAPTVQGTSAASRDVRKPPDRLLQATLAAALAGTAALLALPYAANAIFGVADFLVTGHGRFFQDFINSMDASARDSEAPYLPILWGWLFVNYLFGMISYRLGVGVGRRITSRFGEPLAGTNNRLLLFLTFVCVIVGSNLISSVHTMPNILADMFVLAGAYFAERGIA